MSRKIEVRCIECTFGKDKMGDICPIRLVEITKEGKCVFGGSLSRIEENETKETEKKEQINFFNIDKRENPKVACPDAIEPVVLESCFGCDYCIGFVEMKIACNRTNKHQSKSF